MIRKAQQIQRAEAIPRTSPARNPEAKTGKMEGWQWAGQDSDQEKVDSTPAASSKAAAPHIQALRWKNDTIAVIHIYIYIWQPLSKLFRTFHRRKISKTTLRICKALPWDLPFKKTGRLLSSRPHTQSSIGRSLAVVRQGISYLRIDYGEWNHHIHTSLSTISAMEFPVNHLKDWT